MFYKMLDKLIVTCYNIGKETYYESKLVCGKFEAIIKSESEEKC